MNDAPPPGAFAASTRPPWASTIPATIASPRPAPPLPRSRPPSARQKRSQSSSGEPVGRPGPWSGTSRAPPRAAEAAEGLRGGAGRQAGAVVAHLERDVGAVAADADLDRGAVGRV